MRMILVSVVALGCVGCGITTRPMTNNFVLGQYSSFQKSGTASLSGQAFMRQQGGNVVRCSGEEVVLVPATAFFREILQMGRERAKPENLEALKAEYAPVARRTRCDADGKFKFDNLPPATWIVQTQVRWIVGSVPQGGTLAVETTTTAGQEVSVLLTDREAI